MPPRNRAVVGASTLLQPGYSTVREDERIVDDGLRPRPGDRVLAITSGGCISLKLLLADVSEAVSIDLDPYQTALLQLKAAAARTLSHRELWELLGLAPSKARAALYQQTRAALPPEAVRYWDDQPGEIEAGVTLRGRNDRLLRWIGKAVTTLQGRDRVERLLQCRTLDEQRAFVDGEWNTRRWQTLLGSLLHRRVLGRFVSTNVDPGERLRAEIDHVLRDVPIADNFYLFYMLRGTYRTTDECPGWLMAHNHATIAARVDRLTPKTETLERYLASPDAGTFDGFYLSNIFDWMSPDETERVVALIVGAARPGARVCYWTNLFNEPPSTAALHHDPVTAARLMKTHRAPGYYACTVATL